MKKILIYIVIASMICIHFACNEANNSNELEEYLEVNPGEPNEPKEPNEPNDNPIRNNVFEPIELAAKQVEKVIADNHFAFNIFKEVLASKGSNTFFSPLSLNMALGMLYNGASGETRTEMAKVLGMAGFTEIEINEYYQKMSQALLNIDPLTEISIANSIWYRDGLPVKPPFININQKYFDAAVKALDFNRPDAADTINLWCADKTKDRIKEIIESQIPGNVMMYLINALYFKSNWLLVFDKSNTKQDDFIKTDGQKKKVNMMEQTATLPYYADESLLCVEMPYGNQAFSMVAILPADNMNIEQLIDYLDNTKWQNVVDRMSERSIQLKLPRFKIECEIPLNEPVQHVGMRRIFQGGFANISDSDLRVSEIKQKTFVEVNEEGTEAAAVTVIQLVECLQSEKPVPVQFFANRPFLYLIKEKSTGVILFIGRMDEPEE